MGPPANIEMCEAHEMETTAAGAARENDYVDFVGKIADNNSK